MKTACFAENVEQDAELESAPAFFALADGVEDPPVRLGHRNLSSDLLHVGGTLAWLSASVNDNLDNVFRFV
jgi:hypothetical protein